MNDALRHKLFNYEEVPPLKSWDAVVRGLDEEQDYAFVQKLHEFEAAPGDQCWANIADRLENHSVSVPVVALPPRSGKVARYIGAAAVLIVLGVSAGFLFSSRHQSGLATISDSDQQKKSNAFFKDEEEGSQTGDANAEKELPGPVQKTTVDSEGEGAKSKESTFADRYIAFTNAKGRILKLSKKVMPVFNCAGNNMALNNSRCKEDIRNLQQKMATSVLSPTTDFAGLVDMIKSLDENEYDPN